MESVKEMQKKALFADIEGVIAEQERIAGESAKETETRFMSREEYSGYLDRMGAANFAIGFLGRMKETIGDMDIKRAILHIQWNIHSMKRCGRGDDIAALHCRNLGVLLEGLAERAEERRKWEITPNEAVAV